MIRAIQITEEESKRLEDYQVIRKAHNKCFDPTRLLSRFLQEQQGKKRARLTPRGSSQCSTDAFGATPLNIVSSYMNYKNDR